MSVGCKSIKDHLIEHEIIGVTVRGIVTRRAFEWNANRLVLTTDGGMVYRDDGDLIYTEDPIPEPHSN